MIDYSVARAIFMTLLQAAVLGGAALTLRALDWRPPFWLTVSLAVWAVVNYHEARAVFIGQFAPLGFFALAGALWLLKQRRDGLAGLLLVLATVKPTLVYLVVPFLLVWAAARKRWRFIAGLGGGVLGLSLLSFAALPSWLGDWLQRVVGYTGYRAAQGVVWQVAHGVLPWLGTPGELVLVGALVALMLWQWWRVVRGRHEVDAEFLWALGVTLVVSYLIDSHTATPNYALMLIPTFQVFSVLDQRAGQAGRAVIVFVMLAMLVGHWWLHFATVVGNLEQVPVFYPWPIALGLALAIGRHWLVPRAPQGLLE